MNSFNGRGSELMLTLTFKDKMKDIKLLNRHFENFKRRLKTYFKGILKFEYIVIREPHLSGDWHIHMLFKYEVEKPSDKIPKTIGEWSSLITEKWQQGMVNIQIIEEVPQLAPYLTSHLMDLKVDENGEEIELFSNSHSSKTVAKNQRLNLYPNNMRIYSYSEGFKKPLKEYMRYSDCKREYEDEYEKNYNNSFLLHNDDFALMQRQIQLTKKE